MRDRADARAVLANVIATTHVADARRQVMGRHDFLFVCFYDKFSVTVLENGMYLGSRLNAIAATGGEGSKRPSAFIWKVLLQ